jgi:hypothetical protein
MSSGGLVEHLDTVAAMSKKEGVSAGVDVARPGTDHPDHRPAAVGRRMDPAVAGVPGDGCFDVAVAELGESGAFCGVGLAEVVTESPELLGWRSARAVRAPPRADSAELAVVSDDDQLCSGSFDRSEEPGDRDICRHGPLVEDQHVLVRKDQAVVIESPGNRRDRARVDPGAISEVLGCLS